MSDARFARGALAATSGEGALAPDVNAPGNRACRFGKAGVTILR